MELPHKYVHLGLNISDSRKDGGVYVVAQISMHIESKDMNNTTNYYSGG